jgi:hypothetical protein
MASYLTRGRGRRFPKAAGCPAGLRIDAREQGGRREKGDPSGERKSRLSSGPDNGRSHTAQRRPSLRLEMRAASRFITIAQIHLGAFAARTRRLRRPRGRLYPRCHRAARAFLIGGARLKWNDRTTVHGIRAAFKTWATERTNYPREVVELCLSHVKAMLLSAPISAATFSISAAA